jgi:hypothetical protein
MKENSLVNLEEDNLNNVLDFEIEKSKRLALDSSDPKDPVWLRRLGSGTIFLAKRKGQGQEFPLGWFVVAGKTENGKTYFLLERSLGDKEIPVDPIRFCNVYDLHETLRTHEEFLAELEANKTVEDTKDTIDPKDIGL